MKRRIKKLLCTLLTIIMIFPHVNAFASSDAITATPVPTTKAILYKLDSIESNLSDAEALEKNEISSLVNAQISSYIQTEPLSNDTTISHSEESLWIPLYDLNGNHFADLVPLINENGDDVGFITIGSIRDGFPYYMLSWDVEFITAYRNALETNSQSQAIFFPPMDYGIQTGNGSNRRIFKFNMLDFSLEDTTAIIAENAEFFESQYNSIRSAENASKTARDLSDEQHVASVLKSVPTEDVRLSCEWNNTTFVPVTEVVDGKLITYYGGNQAWFNDDRSNNGCGPVAAANIMYYLSSSSSKYKNLYPYSTITKPIFTAFMGTMYKQINPAIFGEISYSSFADDTVKWAKSRNVDLTVHKSVITFDAKNIIANGIKDGLRKDKPVAILNLNKWYTDETNNNAKLGWHWVTVTKYYQSSSDQRWIAISTWGTRLSVNWDAYYQSMADPLPNLGGGYVWFE